MTSLDMSDQEPNLVRDEGNAFHWLLEKPRPFSQYVNTKAKNGVLYTEEMVEHAEEYLAKIDTFAAFMLEIVTTWSIPNVIEVRGRADCIGYTLDGTLHVLDAKYGYTLVEPENNYTLISHAIGYFRQNPRQDISRVVFHIYQPRGFHPDGVWREHTIDFADLGKHIGYISMQAEKPTHLRVSNQCDGCRAAYDCPALRQSVGVILDMVSGTYRDDLNPQQISHQMQLIDKADVLVKARKSALEDLTRYTLSQGKIVDGYMLEKTYTNRAWIEGFDAETIGLTFGIDAVKKGVISPAQAEKLGADKEVVKAMTERQYSGQALKRRSADQAARKAFGKGK